MNPRKILLIQLRRLGDVLLTTPVIRTLKENYPDAEIDFLTEPPFASVLEGNPFLRKVLVCQKSHYGSLLRAVRREGYDWTLDFMNNPRSAQISFFSGATVRGGYDIPVWKWAYTTRIPRPPIPTYAVESKLDLLRHLGLDVGSGQLPQIALSEPDVRNAAAWCRASGLDGSTKVVGIVPVTRQSSRQWPRRHYDELMGRLGTLPGKAAPTFVLFWGGPQEEIQVSELANGKEGRRLMIPAFSVKEMAYVLSRCDVVVGNDNGPLHLAVAVGTPTLGIYGPTCVGSWNPRRAPHRYVQLEGLGCVGCNHNRCPYGHECMEWMSPRHVSEVVAQMLDSGKPASGAV